MKVISGGQTGVDFAALRAARACGIETGGTAPKGWLTEDGPAPWLADYGLVEHESLTYPPRTEANVRDSDATIWIGNPRSPGARLTLRMSQTHKKPLFWVPKAWVLPDEPSIHSHAMCVANVKHWLLWDHFQVVNVAGNRESSNPGIGKAAEAFLTEVFRKWKEQAK